MSRSSLTPLKALEELTDDELENFVFYLINSPPHGFQNIPKAKVKKKSRETVAEEMIDMYGHQQALNVTVEMLKMMDKNHQASEFQKQMQQKRIKPDPDAVSVKRQRLSDAPSQMDLPGEELQSIVSKLKSSLKEENNFIVEETAKYKNKIPLNEIYTDVIVTKGEGESRNNEHEVLMTENSSCPYETRINFSDIFIQRGIKTVLTKGVAGIGKTVSVQKFIIDWAENKTNQDVIFMFVLPFRKLNLIRQDCSLHELLVLLHPELKGCHSDLYVDKKMLFIFDGLEESRFPMKFRGASFVADVDAKSTVENVIINLINRNLLRSALIWITSRPAAADHIPHQYVDCVTEIQGFSDSEKEQYFRKRVSDKHKADTIISHIRAARNLHIMCHIPVFCWIAVTALQPWLSRKCTGEIPTTLTEMYSYFLLVQISRKNEKFDQNYENDSMALLESNKNMILKLAELAFKQLVQGNILFYGKDLEMCGIDIKESFLHSGVCTAIFKMESEFCRIQMYCFVHLSFQEFFAALYVFHCYLCKNLEEVRMFLPRRKAVPAEIPLDVLMKHAVTEALKNKTGHLDIFLRFLHGMTLESNQRLLRGFLPRATISPLCVEQIKQNLKCRQKMKINPERWLNLSQCLMEMKDDTLQREIQAYLESKNQSKKLSLAHCSAMANMFQMSEEVMDELDLRKYNTTEEGRRRLIPALRNCRKAILADCSLTETSCESIAAALQSAKSPLRELDLSNNVLQNAGLKLLYEGLKSFTCKLETLSVSNCNLTGLSCQHVAAALHSEKSSIRKLDLSYNDLHDGIHHICSGLNSPYCKLITLRISDCKLDVNCCKSIGAALAKSPLEELDLSCNDLRDAGACLLSKGLRSSTCNLSVLKVSDCKLSAQSCTEISSVLQKENSSLRELDLSDNDLLDCGVEALCVGLASARCLLKKLRLSGCCITAKSCSSLISALLSNPKHLTDLDLSYNHPGPSETKRLLFMRSNPSYALQTVILDQSGELRIAPGLKKYAFKLTLDPNIAHSRLSLSADYSRMTFNRGHQLPQDHKQRFENEVQVLSKETLCGRCYWEVEWQGNASIAVAYKSISKRGNRSDCVFGCSRKSWSLELSGNGKVSAVLHNNTDIAISHPQCNRVGVFVDDSAGILSFHAVCTDTHTLTQIHTFRTTFREPLYAGFGLDSSVFAEFGHESSVSLIHS